MSYVRIITGDELRVGDRINGREVLAITRATKLHPTLGPFRVATLPAPTPSGRVEMSVFDHHCVTVDAEEPSP